MSGIPAFGTDAFKGLQAATTSHYGLGGDASMIQSVTISWDAVTTAVITIWSTDFPEVLVTSTNAREWVQQNPPTGYTAISPAGAATAATPLVLTIPGGTAGCASLQIGNSGTLKLKAQVVCTVAGQLRITPHGKQ